MGKRVRTRAKAGRGHSSHAPIFSSARALRGHSARCTLPSCFVSSTHPPVVVAFALRYSLLSIPLPRNLVTLNRPQRVELKAAKFGKFRSASFSDPGSISLVFPPLGIEAELEEWKAQQREKGLDPEQILKLMSDRSANGAGGAQAMEEHFTSHLQLPTKEEMEQMLIERRKQVCAQKTLCGGCHLWPFH